jgi:hypothetical protein
MRREHHGGPGAYPRFDAARERSHRGGVERRERLVEDPHRPLLRQNEPRECHSPPLPRREHPHGQIALPRKAERFESGVDRRPVVRQPLHCGEVAQVFPRAQELMHRRQMAVEKYRPVPGIPLRRQRHSLPAHFSLIRLRQAAEQAQ